MLIPSSVQAAVKLALDQGYELSPEAVKLLKDIAGLKTHKVSGTQQDLIAIIRIVIDEKAKTGVGVGSSKTVDVSDLVKTFPDVFEVSHSAEDSNRSEKREFSDVEQDLVIVEDPSAKIKPTGTEGFTELFKSRYEKIVKIMMERPESRQLTRIAKMKSEKGSSKIAGLVLAKRQLKNGIEIVLDDDSGTVSAVALSVEARNAASQVTLDQCVMAEVESGNGRLVLKNVIQPDIPSKVSSTSKKTVYAVFLSDLHIGSNKFLEGAFDRFLQWISGKSVFSADDDEIVTRLKYVIIGGDVVDGVGVFPNQEYELVEQDIYKQYQMVAEKLKLIPKRLQVLIIPGNHDATRQALPQPMIPRKYAAAIHELTNVTMLGDPCLFELHGVSVLSFHGRSLDDVLATTPGLSYERPTEAMKVLLRARHLAPMFGSRTPIAPEIEDYLVIDKVPDIFHAGHVHTVGVESYKSALIINSGTWQAQTGYQANLGITPRPGLVPIVNLATLGVTFREFLTTSSVAG